MKEQLKLRGWREAEKRRADADQAKIKDGYEFISVRFEEIVKKVVGDALAASGGRGNLNATNSATTTATASTSTSVGVPTARLEEVEKIGEVFGESGEEG